MIFKTLLNVDSAFRLTRTISYTAIIGSLLVNICTICLCYRLIEKQREKIYVLDKGKSLILALSQDLAQNRPVEAKNHVKMFHELFFTLAPDAEAIRYNTARALHLADKSAYDYFQDLSEAGYYRRIISANVIQRFVLDSIEYNMDSYPYQIRTYARQIILRESNITKRSLITQCLLENTSRSDNNPHGFLITNFKITANKDIQNENRIE